MFYDLAVIHLEQLFRQLRLNTIQTVQKRPTPALKLQIFVTGINQAHKHHLIYFPGVCQVMQTFDQSDMPTEEKDKLDVGKEKGFVWLPLWLR